MRRSLAEVMERLAAEGLVEEEALTATAAALEQRAAAQPWYVRVMVGAGAWLASLLLIGFVAGLAFVAQGGLAIIGLLFLAAAIAVRRGRDGDFVVQFALALALAGQGLLLWGISRAELIDTPEAMCLTAIAVSACLFFLFPDRIHRTLMVLFAAGSLTTLVFLYEANDLVPLLGPAFAAALLVVYDRQGRIMAAGHGEFVTPLLNGLMLSAFGCLLLSTIYVLPELSGDGVRFYPRPWVSAIALGTLLLFVIPRIRPGISGETPGRQPGRLYALLFGVVVACHAAPGILLALLVVILGADSGHRAWIGGGIGFLALFLAAYFYGIEVSMAAKSATLVMAGLAALAARRLLPGIYEPHRRPEEPRV